MSQLSLWRSVSCAAWSWVALLNGRERRLVLALIGILLVVWLVVAVLGFVIKGLFWLAVVGIVLFLGTAAYGAVKHRAGRRAA